MNSIVVVGVVVVIVLAAIPAKIAANKGRSPAAFFVFGLLFFVPAVVVAALIPVANGQRPCERCGRSIGMGAATCIRCGAAQSQFQQPVAPRPAAPIADALAEVDRLAALRDRGTISEEEFVQLKRQLLR